MRRAVALLALVALVGCNEGPGTKVADPGTNSGTFTESDVKLNDGRTVHCLFWVTGFNEFKVGGMSCDWPH